jgi:hypothetical protein
VFIHFHHTYNEQFYPATSHYKRGSRQRERTTLAPCKYSLALGNTGHLTCMPSAIASGQTLGATRRCCLTQSPSLSWDCIALVAHRQLHLCPSRHLADDKEGERFFAQLEKATCCRSGVVAGRRTRPSGIGGLLVQLQLGQVVSCSVDPAAPTQDFSLRV